MKELFTPLDQAKYAVVHDFPGGAARLGPLTGIHPTTLCNNVNPGQENHHLTVDEAIRVQTVAGDYRILYAESSLLNHISVPLGDYRLMSDAALLDVYTKFHAEVGEAAVALNSALSDGRVSRREANDFRREMFEVFQAGLELCNRLEGIVDE
jgi:hypothetical protein